MCVGQIIESDSKMIENIVEKENAGHQHSTFSHNVF